MKKIILISLTISLISCNAETLLPKWEKESTAMENLIGNMSKESIEKKIADIDKSINRIENIIRNLDRRANVFERVNNENEISGRNYITLQVNYLNRRLLYLHKDRSDLMEILYILENKNDKL